MLPPSSTKLPPWIEAAVHEHWAAVARTIRRCGAPDKDCADLVADVFVTAWEQRAKLVTASPKPWLLGIAWRVGSNYRKSARATREVFVEPDTVSGAPDPEQAALAREKREQLYDLIARLPPERSAALMLHLEDLTADEIAAELGILPKTAAARVQLAIRDVSDEMARRQARAERPMSRRRLPVLVPADLFQRDVTGGSEIDHAACRRVFDALREALAPRMHDESASSRGRDDDDGPRGDGEHDPGSGRSELAATARPPIPANAWTPDILASAATLGRWLLSQLPAAVVGAATVVVIHAAENPPAAVATAVPLRDEYAAVTAPPSASVAPTAAVGAPTIGGAPAGGPVVATAGVTEAAARVVGTEAEQTILDIASAENRSQNPHAAHATLKRLDKVQGQRDEERAILEIQAVIGMGNMVEAERLAEAFRKKYPNSMQIWRLDAALKRKP